MTRGRIRLIDRRLYVDGYNLSSELRTIGSLDQNFDKATDDSVLLPVKKTWPAQGDITPGTANMLFDNTALTGTHIVLPTAGGMRNLALLQGIQAAPAAGDPAFIGRFPQLAYKTADANGLVAANIPWGSASGDTLIGNYATPWGIILHAESAEVGANTSVGFDLQSYFGTGTIKGGYMGYHVTAGAGTGNITAAIKVQHAATNADGSFTDLLSTGTINLGSGGVFSRAHGFVALAYGAAVSRYVRWQISFTLATSVTLLLVFVPNFI